MDYDAVEKQLQEKRDQVEKLKALMKIEEESFTKSLGDFIAPQFLSIAEKVVKGFPETTEKLTRDQLKKIKVTASSLAENSYEIASQELEDSTIAWFHKVETKSPSGYHSSQLVKKEHKTDKVVPETGLYDVIKYCLGRLGNVLQECGYVRSDRHSTTSDSYKALWFDFHEQNKRKKVNKRGLYYPDEVTISQEMIALAFKYQELRSEAMQLLREIDKINEEYKKAKASDAWDSI